MYPKELERFLLKTQKPGRYTGGEQNSVIKDKNSVDIRFAFCFPDVYEIGASHLGMKILYALVNAREDAWCERVFAPRPDMEKIMRDASVPLYGLESGDPIRDFDIIGFTLQYELSYTAVLNMLDLAGLPVRARDRTGLTPIVITGGPCVCNSEPTAEFIDAALLGDGEEVTNEFIDLLKEYKAKRASKKEFLIAASRIKGVYVPSLYEVEYNGDKTVKSVSPTCGAPAKVEKRSVADLDSMFAPSEFVVPFIEIVHDRTTVELFRGCARGCRFCQAGFINRPVRARSPEVVEAQCRAICENTGYDEISLCSLSSSDYKGLETLLTNMLPWATEQKINVSLPSLRADNFPKELAEKLDAVRRSGLTFAPEAGTQRLRDVINKNLTEEEILNAAARAFAGGRTAIKLYFMIGLPTETLEDIKGIAGLAQAVVDEFYKNPNKPKGRGANVSVSVASFVPKPFTPFQWEPQDRPEILMEKQKYLRSNIKTRKVSVSFPSPRTSFLEGVLARGDRRLCDVVETAWRKGCRLDGWKEFFKPELWDESFAENGADPYFYTARRREYDEVLPWEHMKYGATKKFLANENEKARRGETSPLRRKKRTDGGENAPEGGAR